MKKNKKTYWNGSGEIVARQLPERWPERKLGKQIEIAGMEMARQLPDSCPIVARTLPERCPNENYNLQTNTKIMETKYKNYEKIRKYMKIMKIIKKYENILKIMKHQENYEIH